MKSPILAIIAILLVPSLPLVFTGCAAAPAADEAAADLPPPDFTLSMTVMGPTNRRALAPRATRPCRFVIETDWVLRRYVGPVAADDTFPPETRQLAAPDIAAIWSDLRSSGLLDPNHPAIVGHAPTVSEVLADGKAIWVVAFTADIDRRTLVLDPDPDGPVAPLLNRLADLAWMRK